MANVFLSDIPTQLQETLDVIVTDPTDGVEAKARMPKYFMVESMAGNAYSDELETADEGLVPEKGEGAALEVKGYKEGPLTRYNARAFGRKMVISREAMDDGKYNEHVKLAKRNKRQIWKTVDYDAANVLIRAENTSYVGADGQPLASASHTLPWGGTFSNKMATPMTPSVQAIIVAVSQLKVMPGHDGNIEGYEPKKVVFPSSQWGVWASLLKSEMNPEAGNFSEINVVKSELSLEPVEVPFWNTTTTEWAIITDADDGLKWKWHTKPESNSWVDNDNMVVNYSTYARWARGWTNPRGVFYNGAS